MKIAYRIFLSQFNSVKNCFLQKLLSKSIDDPDPRVSTHGWRATVRWRAAARPRAVMQCSQARVGHGADTPSAQLHCACCNTAPVSVCSARTLHMWAATGARGTTKRGKALLCWAVRAVTARPREWPCAQIFLAVFGPIQFFLCLWILICAFSIFGKLRNLEIRFKPKLLFEF